MDGAGWVQASSRHAGVRMRYRDVVVEGTGLDVVVAGSRARTDGSRVGFEVVTQDDGIIEVELGIEPGMSRGVCLVKTRIASPLLDAERTGSGLEALVAELPGFEADGTGEYIKYIAHLIS